MSPHQPHSSYTALTGLELETWALTMAERLMETGTGDDVAAAALLTVLAKEPADSEGRHQLPDAPWVRAAAERLSDTGLAFIFRAGYQTPVAVKLHAYNPPVPWAQPTEPAPTPPRRTP